MRVGFIGRGSQGAPMARRIVEGGYELTLWARRPASVEPYADTAAKIATTIPTTTRGQRGRRAATLSVFCALRSFDSPSFGLH